MAEGDSQVQGVLVEIFGDSYRIGGDPRQVQQVAAYVDAKMRQIAGSRTRLPKAQVAILAAMEITAELFSAMSQRQAFTQRAHESIEKLTRLVEDRGRLAAAPPLKRRLGDEAVRRGQTAPAARG